MPLLASAFPVEELRTWFLANKRNFPWREKPSPYRVWISEVMLQQTRAEVVVPYFISWMQRFPSIEALASATEEEVVKAWEGLGYYSRARNLLHAARMIVERFEGKLPTTFEELSAIKGLGLYTANAIRAFAFHQKAAPVDGNVLRSMSRVFKIPSAIDLTSTKKEVVQLVEDFLPDDKPYEIAEALIELGACICKKTPICEQCPVQEFCQAYQDQEQSLFPIRKIKQTIIPLIRGVAVIIYKGAVVLEKRANHELMAGLYEFPYIDVPSKNFLSPELFLEGMAEVWSSYLTYRDRLPGLSQTFTHYKVSLYPFIFSATQIPSGVEVYPLTAINELPFSSGHRKIKAEVLLRYGTEKGNLLS